MITREGYAGRGPAPSLRRPGAGRVRRLQGWPEGIGDEEQILKSLLVLNMERSVVPHPAHPRA